MNKQPIHDPRFKSSRREAPLMNHESCFLNPIKVKPGFTLIETLVAVSVLLVSLAGPLSIASKALQSAYYAREQVTAFYLAQEAIEYVRTYREQNYLTPPNNWLVGIDNCIDTACTVDFKNFNHEVCGVDGCGPLLIGSVDGLYNIESGDPSIFTRTLTLSAVPGNPDEIVVGVTVSWPAGTLTRTFELTEHMFDWL